MSPIRRVSADTLLTADDSDILVDASAGHLTITLPPKETVPLDRFTIKKIDSTANVVSVVASDGSNIDDSSIVRIHTPFDEISVKPDGTQYWNFAPAIIQGAIDICKDYGADPTGGIDIGGPTGALGKAVARAAARGGGRIRIPHGKFLWNAQIAIATGGIEIVGDGFEEYSGYQGQFRPPHIGTHGTYINTTSTVASPLYVQGNEFQMQNLAFTQAQPADANGWTPIVYPATIQHGGTPDAHPTGGGLYENVFFFNVYNPFAFGLASGDATAGRVTLRRISGTPLSAGIIFNFCGDTMTVDNLHWWPYGIYPADGVTTGMLNWITHNCNGIVSYRNDNPLMSNIFTWGLATGIFFASNAMGATSNACVVNAQFDNSLNGMVFGAQGGGNMLGQFTNIMHYGPATVGGDAGRSIVCGGGVVAAVTNMHVSAVQSEAILINAATGSDLTFTNLFIDGFNNNSPSSSSVLPIAGPAGNTITLSGRYRQLGGGASSGNAPGGGATINSSHAN